MKVSERIIRPGTITSIRQLTGGRIGYVYLLVNDKHEHLVVKWQPDAASITLAATYILQGQHIHSPSARKANPIDIVALRGAAIVLSKTNNDTQVLDFINNCDTSPTANHKTCRTVLLMTYVAGPSMSKAKTDNYQDFLAVIHNAEFQKDLGNILAIDEFLGNPDCFKAYGSLAGVKSFEPGTKAFCNNGNVIIKSSRSVAVIDNAMTDVSMKDFSWLMTRVAPYGVYEQNIASMAAAHLSYAQTEACFIYRELIKQPPNNATPDEESSSTGQTHASCALLPQWENERQFVRNVSCSAVETMRRLLEPNQHWVRTLVQQNILRKDVDKDNEIIAAFRYRKAVLRALRDGKTPESAYAEADSEFVARVKSAWANAKRSRQMRSPILGQRPSIPERTPAQPLKRDKGKEKVDD